MSTPHPASDSASLPASDPTCVARPATDSQTLAAWFTEEVHPYGGQLKAYLKGAFPAVRDVDDLVQESYLQIWKAKASKPITSAKSYLFTIARHLALDFVRRERTAPIMGVGSLDEIQAVDSRPGAADLLSDQEKLALLADAIAALPDRMREIILLHKVDGHSQPDVARQLGLAEKTVANLVARGVERCRNYLRRHGIEHF